LEAKAIFAPHVVGARDMIAEEKAELGFTALSLLNPQKKIEGSVWIVPQKLYSPIEQQAVLLKFAENKAVARAFLDFLKTPQAHNIIEKYSYSVPVRKP
jgi:molybdate transport system substrate-binding protein